MDKFRYTRSVWLAASVCAVIGSLSLSLGCNPAPLDQTAKAPVYLRIAEQVPGSRTLLADPSPSLEELTLILSGEGPGSATQEAMTIQPDRQLELWLVPGSWTLRVEAFDPEQRLFLAGSTTVEVRSGRGAAAKLGLSPVPGVGTLDVLYRLPETTDPEASWQCSLKTMEGVVTQSWNDPAGSPDRAIGELPSGYYLLETALFQEDSPLCSSVSLVRILAGYATSVEAAPVLSAQRPDLELELLAAKTGALTPTPLSRACIRGVGYRVQVEPVQGFGYSWYADGNPVGTGALAILDTSHFAASTVVSVFAHPLPGSETVAKGIGGAAGSITVQAETRSSTAGYLAYALLNSANEAGAYSLDQAARLASSADATRLVLLSDADGSRLSVWDLDPQSTEPRFRSEIPVRLAGSAKRADLLALSPDGSLVMVANSSSNWLQLLSIDQTGRLQELASFTSLSPGMESLSYPRAARFSPDGKSIHLLCSSSRSILSLGKTTEGWSPVSTLRLDELPSGTLSSLKDMAFSPSGDRLALAAAGSDVVVLLDVTESGLVWYGELRRTAGHAQLDAPQSVAFGHDNASLLVSCSVGPTLLLYALGAEGPSLLDSFSQTDGLPANGYGSLVWQDTAGTLFMTGTDGLAVFSIADGKLLYAGCIAMTDNDGSPAVAAIAPCGTWLMAAQPQYQRVVLLAPAY